MRLQQLTVDTLTPEQRELYDAIIGRDPIPGRNPTGVADAAGQMQGPFNAMVHNPRIGMPLQRLGGVLRFRGSLPDRARELVILTTAAAWESEFEWWAHVRIGRDVGLTEGEIAAVRSSAPLALDDPVEQAALDVAGAAAATGDLDDGQYARAREALGDPMLIETLTLFSYYALLALQMRVFRVPLPDGAEPSFE